jgi:hypothetical protein
MTVSTYKLLAGKHTAYECDRNGKYKTTKILNPETGEETEQRVQRQYKAGELIHTETDLIEKHGANKFERISGPGPRPKSKAFGGDDEGSPLMNADKAIAPGGQVSSGKQVTVRLPDGTYASVVETELNRPKTTQEKEKFQTEFEGHDDPSHPDDADENGDEEDLRTLNMKELKKVAEDEGVDTEGLRSKEAVITAILEHREAQGGEGEGTGEDDEE